MRGTGSPGAVGVGGRRGARATRRAGERGYSLLELIIAVSIMGIAVALALPMLNSKPVNLGADLQDLSLNLQVAREFAMSRTQHYRVRVFSAGPPYQYAIEGYSGGAWGTARTITLRSNIAFDSATLGLTAEFDTRGMLVSASPPLTFALRDTAHNWSKTITVNAVGMVDRQ